MNDERPVWLDDEPELQALLNAVLDRFDHQSGETRQRSIVLSVERFLPSLARADTAADQQWSLLNALQSQGVLSIRLARRSPYDPEWQGAKVAFAPQSEDLLRQWLARPVSESAMLVWRRAVEAHGKAFEDGGTALAARRVLIADRTAEEIVAAFARIAAVAGPVTLRQLSARVFWGDSKVLDERGPLIAQLFPRLEIRERPIVVAVHLPVSCHGVLFIENQDTYAAAVAGSINAARELALVYASGFRSTAERIRRRSGALLHFAGPGEENLRRAFEEWWFEQGPALGACRFWGDLDFSGMQILKTLRTRFADVGAWREGYEPMLEVLRARGGYMNNVSDAASQVDPLTTGCVFADDVLLPAIRQLGRLDQEGWHAG